MINAPMQVECGLTGKKYNELVMKCSTIYKVKNRVYVYIHLYYKNRSKLFDDLERIVRVRQNFTFSFFSGLVSSENY